MPVISNTFRRNRKSDRPYVKKCDRPFPHPRPSAYICGSKVRSTGASKRAIDLSPIRVHPRVSAVQKCDRPLRQKERSTFPPSASIRVHPRFKSAPFRQKERSPFPPSASIRVYLRFKRAIGLTISHKNSTRPTISSGLYTS